MFSQGIKGTVGTLSKTAQERIVRDLKDLDREPIKGASAGPSENDLSKIHCNLEVSEGPYVSTVLHFVLEMPENYPASAPHAFFVSPITYHNGASMKDSKGRTVICLNLFGNFSFFHTEWGHGGDASGWTSSYSISSILINLQAVFMDQYLSTSPSAIKNTRTASAKLKCECGHNPDNSDLFPVLPTQDEIDEKQKIIADKIKNKLPEIVCYVSKEVYGDKVDSSFGYGVNVTPNFVTTPGEPMTQNSFESGVRTSSTNKDFKHWIPMYVNPEHWKTAEKLFVNAIKSITFRTSKDTNIRTLDVLSSLMNNMVVEVMNSQNASANDKFIDAYFAFYRILVHLSEKNVDLVKYVDDKIKSFIENENKRNKTAVPNLGDWLVMLLISSKYSWNDVSKVFVNECDTRNVFWYAVGNSRNPAAHPDLLNKEIKKGRSQKVFAAASVSRKLICFQTRFFKYAKDLSMANLDARNGIIPYEIKGDLKNMHADVSAMKSWNEYFAWNKMEIPSTEQRDLELIEAVKNAERSGYLGGGKKKKNRQPNRGGSRY